MTKRHETGQRRAPEELETGDISNGRCVSLAPSPTRPRRAASGAAPLRQHRRRTSAQSLLTEEGQRLKTQPTASRPSRMWTNEDQVVGNERDEGGTGIKERRRRTKRIKATSTKRGRHAELKATRNAYFLGSSFFSSFFSLTAPVERISLIFSSGWPLMRDATLAQPRWSKDLISM